MARVARQLRLAPLAIAGLLAVAAWAAPLLAAPPITLETEFVRYAIGPDGLAASFIDKRTGKDYCPRQPREDLAVVVKDGKAHGPAACSESGDLITVTLDGGAGTVDIKATSKGRYLVLEIVSVSDPKITEITFPALRLSLAKHTNRMSGIVTAGDTWGTRSAPANATSLHVTDYASQYANKTVVFVLRACNSFGESPSVSTQDLP